MGMQLSGLAQLVARLKGLDDGHPESFDVEGPDAALHHDIEEFPPPATDPFADVARAVGN
jgi:hypothetical protein